MIQQTLKPDPFYDRRSELEALDRAWSRRGAGGQMMLLYGRRRLGKTYLLQRYCAGGVTGDEAARPHCYFLAEQTTAAAQRHMLARELSAAIPDTAVPPEDIAVSWGALLRHVSQHARARDERAGRFALILDEFPYLVQQSPELPSVLQAWWDREGVHARLLVVLCGSQLSAMAALGVESSPMFGRFNAGVFVLGPLAYQDVAEFYAESPHYRAAETLLMYGVLGGTPRYHALVDTSRPAADEIVDLLMKPRAILENEVRFLLGSEQIREPAPYNAVLAAVASGETQFGGIMSHSGLERSNLTFNLRVLQELGWLWREFPFGERSERRAQYRIADPFLAFWYRFIAPLASALQFSDPAQVFRDRIAPRLSEYMGWSVFESVCAQWLQRAAASTLGAHCRQVARYWSRDGSLEIDMIAELDDGSFVFAECKWRAQSAAVISDYIALRSKVERLPEARWRARARYVLFSVGGFAPELEAIARSDAANLILVSGTDLLSRHS